MNEEMRELYIKASLGYITTILYFVITYVLMTNIEPNTEHPEYALYILGAGAAINFVASTIIIRYGNINDKDITWHITRLAVAHTPALIGLFLAMIHLVY